MYRKVLSLVAGGLATFAGVATWSRTAVADEPRNDAVPVKAAISTDSGAPPIHLVDRRRGRHHYRRHYRDGWGVSIGLGSPYYYDYGYGYGSYYPRYRYYSYPRYYAPYGYYDPYYSPRVVYYNWY